MKIFFIGLMSGTSMDGIDAVLVDITKQKPALVKTFSLSIPKTLYQNLQRLCQAKTVNVQTLYQTDIAMGKQFAKAALTLLKKARLSPQHIKAIGCHGQTLWHYPAQGFSVQIGDPNTIAYLTGIPVVADFRQKDIAAKGEGAPLAPLFHAQVFKPKKGTRVILNIGGIANITVLPAHSKQPVTACDTGPGNTLLDGWIQKHRHLKYDQNGHWAAGGKIEPMLLKQLLRDPYFKKRAPKSTGREYFNLAWLSKQIKKTRRRYRPQDIQATLAELTAMSIIETIQQLSSKPIQDILICGGGAHNDDLLKRIQQYAGAIKIKKTDAFNISVDWVEAIAFAWLAKQTLQKRKWNLRSITGSQKKISLGGIYSS